MRAKFGLESKVKALHEKFQYGARRGEGRNLDPNPKSNFFN